MDKKRREPSSNARSNSADDKGATEEVYFNAKSSDPYFRDQNSEMNLESIVSAPVIAVSKANSMMLSGQLSFLMDYCFIKTFREVETEGGSKRKEEFHEPKMVNLVVRFPEETEGKHVKENTTIIKIPILTLIPINSLGVDKMNVDFSMEITSVSSYKNMGDPALERKAQLSGKISSAGKQKEQENGSAPENRNLKVVLEANKLPLPVGLVNMIEALNKNTYS